VLIQGEMSEMTGAIGDAEVIGDGLKYATMVVATLPIMCLYPFLQKYFVKGVMIGAVKG
jgi:putative aldouronate transport system permease protein